MTVANAIIQAVKTAALNEFDSYTHIAVGSSNNAESPADTTLGAEFFREIFADKVKNEQSGTYLFSIQLGLTEGNGNEIREIGVFDSASNGNMALRKVLNSSINKTADKEVWIDVEVSVNVT